MAVVSDITKKYLDMLEEKFDVNNFCSFIIDLLNLNQDNIINGAEQKAGSEQYKHYIDTAKLYAQYEDEKRRKVGVIIIKLQDNKNPANARTLQRNYIAHLLDHYSLDASLTAIYSDTDDTWRFSFVKQELEITVGKLKTKVSPAKRYSYLFGKNEPNHTAKEQLLELLEKNDRYYSIEEIEEKFSVEKVTKDFFERYKENYLKLYENLEANKEFIEESKKYGFTTEEFAKKLMGQIVFLYFLQKKGWLGVSLVPKELSMEEYNSFYQKEDSVGKKVLDKYYISSNNKKRLKGALLKSLKENEQEIEELSDVFVNSKYDKEWGTGEKNFVRQLFIRYKNMNATSTHDKFFDDYLEPFFYNGLNYRRKNQYFSVFNCKIPFLNGGLFEPIDNYRWDLAEFKIEDEIFSNDEETGILDFFDRYNFTINEEEPLEKDVAVDPEMLGKIFENLLDVKDRKSKGAFYTPREIVHYMCQESLANYLVNKLDVNYDEIIEFIQYGDMIRDEDLKNATRDNHILGDSIFNNVFEIDEALKNIKIADPAVGSGAFPLGILNEIVKLRDIITSYIIIYNRIGELEKRYGKQFDDNQILNSRSIYSIKWNTIKNSIYAVDIENSAVDITKLRLWLSIVVDQISVPKTGPEPLPNLDCKIMQGNSLIDEFAGVKLIDKNLIDESKNDFEIKPVGKKSIDNQMRLFAEEKFGEQYGFFSDEKRSIINELIKKKAELFGINNTVEKKRILEEIDKCRKNLLDVNFRGNDKLSELIKIDNSHNKPYFSWELEFIEVFVENNGFDIVIGNPPYVGEDEHKDIFEPIKKSGLGRRFYCGKMDLLYFFFHLALDISNNYSTMSFITTNYFITADGALKLRKDLKERASLKNIINFNESKVFDSARGQHNIITLYSHKANDDAKCKIWNFNREQNLFENNKLSIMNNLNKIESNEDISIYYIENDNLYSGKHDYLDIRKNYVDGSKEEKIILYLEKIKTKICDIAIINQGIATGANKVINSNLEKLDTKNDDIEINDGIFILDLNNERDVILINSFNDYEKSLLKPYYKNSDIKKYFCEYDNSKLIIYIDRDMNEVEKIPNIIAHLSKFKPILEQRRENVSGLIKFYQLQWPREEMIFKTNKIMIPYRCKTNNFAYCNKDWYFSTDCYCITADNDDKLKYILGLLNSKAYLIWLKNKGKVKGDMLEFMPTALNEIPIIDMSEDDEKTIINLVDNILNNGNYEKEIDEIENIIMSYIEKGA